MIYLDNIISWFIKRRHLKLVKIKNNKGGCLYGNYYSVGTYTKKTHQFIEIIFDENNEITINQNTKLIKDDIIRIIQEVAKLKTID